MGHIEDSFDNIDLCINIHIIKFIKLLITQLKGAPMTSQEMLDYAIEEMANLNTGERFVVKDLFKGYVWNRQKRAERLTLGTLFKNYAKRNDALVRIVEKSRAGQQEYEIK